MSWWIGSDSKGYALELEWASAAFLNASAALS